MKEFSAEVKAAFEREIALNRAKNCQHIFQHSQAKQIIKHIKQNYDSEPEFLWLKFPRYAVFRHSENKKWYAVLIAINARKLGLKNDEVVNVINIKAEPKSIINLVYNKRYFKAYHMNKKHWLSILLDENAEFKAVCELIAISYEMTRKK